MYGRKVVPHPRETDVSTKIFFSKNIPAFFQRSLNARYGYIVPRMSERVRINARNGHIQLGNYYNDYSELEVAIPARFELATLCLEGTKIHSFSQVNVDVFEKVRGFFVVNSSRYPLQNFKKGHCIMGFDHRSRRVTIEPDVGRATVL